MTRPFQLPNDVLLLVGEQLDNHADRWNLIFISQRFHDLFLSLVYRTVRLNHWRDAYSFICAITKRPSLARVVRELDLSRWRKESIPQADWDVLQRSSILKGRLEVSSYSQDETAQWVEHLAQGRGDTWSALMLPLLTQLWQLHLVYSIPSICLNRIMQRAINNERPFQSQPAFQHLSKVSLHHREDLDRPTAHVNAGNGSHEDQSALLLSFFQLPSMRSVFANSVVDPTSISIVPDLETEETEQVSVARSSITEIDLRRSSGNRGMDALIATCADLKSFKYQHSDSHLTSHGYQPTAFYRSLTRSKRSLQSLWLDHYGDHYPFTSAGLNQTHDEWFGSLADFSALRELRIRLANLLDIRYQSEPISPLINSLPGSLEILYIEGCEERHMGMLVSQLRTVIRNRRSQFPHLRCLNIEGSFRNASADELGDTSASAPEPADDTIKPKIVQAAEPLHEDCASAGLELHVYDRTFSQKPH
ncbi:uncharacterized protein N7473_005117 [Penicillium subrubescens]|uniref:Leucine-rich repeat domain-containing protein n=1 Tax=Penicillium subrubescens TaxID=1316194 RepID=A0A1Q5UF46_9EURO|nr:uncharacterized protein N7473_005117 [Penicillium subrubescens]KAJ5895718.1 hypothetical protein N7473_005117 [Penicillium subrubescens]OKP11100.1 hypothetical protein PENSUB_3470 [Penicillium subrubescens]